MLEISFENKTKIEMESWQKMAEKLIHSLIRELEISIAVSLSINFVTKTEALKLNQDYRHENYVPDVISFPSGIDFVLAKKIGYYEWGDLFICFEVAKQKAEFYHHDLETEMAFLFVHGSLHLIGYDHESENEKQKMFSLQDKILKINNYHYDVFEDDLDYL